MYDLDIEKILFSSPILKEKTYFIIGVSPTKKEQYTLSKYGHVLPIGVDGFSNHLNDSYISSNEREEFWLDCFNKYNIKDIENPISDNQISDFILYGSYETADIDNAITSQQKKPFIIIRACISKIEELLSENKNVVILGDFGNGKTILMQELMAHFSVLGGQVYFLDNSDGDFARDIEKIHGKNMLSYVFIDDYSIHLDVLTHLAKFNSENIKIIFSDRTYNHDRLRIDLSEFLTYHEISTDILQKEEMEHFVAIIDNLGVWGDKAYLSPERKVNLISTKNRKQISHTLLQLFNSPQIKDRIKSLLYPIMSDPKFKDTIFALCLVEIANLPLRASLISEISGHDFIYSSELRKNSNFNQIFGLKSNIINTKSSLFSTSLLNNHFAPSYITDKLLDLVEKYDSQKANGTAERELFKLLLRFSFIERLLPAQNKLNSLVKYYEELKVRVYWLKTDPHFWLQYGMARMNHGQLDKAQSNLDTSYGIAHAKSNYNTEYLDTQQARLFILKATNENDGSIIWDFFQKAHNLLLPLKEDIYKYRQVTAYKRFFDNKYGSLSKKNKNQFVLAVIKMKTTLEKSGLFIPDNAFCDYTISSCHRYLSEILEKTR